MPCRAMDMSQDDHVRPLPLAGRSVAIGTQATLADIQYIAHPLGAEGYGVFFDEPEPHCF